MWNVYHHEELLRIEMAQRKRVEAYTRFGRQVARAPKRLFRLGLDDFRRYRRPAES